MSFFPWFSLWYCLFGFLFKSSQLSSQVFAKQGFASVQKFVRCEVEAISIFSEIVHVLFFAEFFDVHVL